MLREIVESVLKAWGNEELGKQKKAFDRGGHLFHGGPQWRPLSPSTLREDTGSPLPLSDSGGLKRDSFISFAGTSLLIGNKNRLAAIHHTGTRTIPARPIVVVTQQDLNELKAELKRALEKVAI